MKQIFRILTLLFYGILTAQTINGKIISKENGKSAKQNGRTRHWNTRELYEYEAR